MIRIGITGNIGCGKSTVAQLLDNFPHTVYFDADTIAKEILVDPDNRTEILEIVSTGVLEDGEICFARVATVIFSRHDIRHQLETYIHPKVWQYVDEKIDSKADNTVVIVESAIIFERDLVDDFDAVVVVTCSKEEQVRRLRQNRKMSEEDMMQRIHAQLPQSEKIMRADYVVGTDGDVVFLEAQVAELYQWILDAQLEGDGA